MGIRLVRNTVEVSSSTTLNTTSNSTSIFMSLQDVLQDESLAPLLSDEGVQISPRLPVYPIPACACWQSSN